MKKFLKLISIITILCVSLTFKNVLAATAEVQINGEIVDFTDSEGNKVDAQIINSRTMVPLRKIFELFGCEIEWDGETKTVFANKDEKEIVLQIDNLDAKMIENGVEQIIQLDTAPVIVNNRTLVPLRFIAESLAKQVGWDSSNYTAIIIDYDYFTNLIEQKNSNLYHVLNPINKDTSFSITRKYTNYSDTTSNSTATLNGNVLKEGEVSKVTLDFIGNDELMQEIDSEGWAHLEYEAKYSENKIAIKTKNEALQKILGVQENNFTEFDIENFNIIGTQEDNFSQAIKNLMAVEDSKLTISTFEIMKTNFNTFINLFVLNGSRNLNYENAKLEKIDYTRFDNIVYGNEIFRTLSFINQTIFHYDVLQDELLYDWKNINYTLNCENNILVLNLILENDYNEKVEYIIECK